MINAGGSAEGQNVASRMGAVMDTPGPRDVAQKKAGAKDGAASTAADSESPQMFDQLLSNAAIVQKPKAEAPASKPKTTAADLTDSLKEAPAATPDIPLLMSLLPALPQNGSAPVDVLPSVPPDSAGSIATSAIPSVTLGRAAPAPPAANNLLTAQLPSAEAPSASGPMVAVAVSTAAASDAPPVIEGKMTDKADLFASVLANIESPSSPAPMLAVPTHQAPTLTAVALALPVTAPGALDELPLAHAEWPAALGHRLLWAVGEGIQKVEISVNPQDMGPINVHIRVENDKADIRFTAAHAPTRDVLEASIPRLRDMFSQQGLNLAQAQVFSQASGDAQGRQPQTPQPGTGASTSNTSAEAQEPETTRVVHWRRGLVDDYA